MPIGYLVTTALMGLCTAFALAPPRPRRSSPSNKSYWLGFLLNELPFLGFYWLLASTLLAVGQGDIVSPVGWLALGVAVITSAGLGVVAWRGLQARQAVDQALEESLGTGWRRSVEVPRRRLPWGRILFAPFVMRRRDVERIKNVSYGDAGRLNLLDVYRSRGRPAGCPTLIYLHGGAFRGGRKSKEALPLIHRLASQGWVCISANYRLSPAATFPDQLIDVKKVIAWVRDHGDEYGADPGVLVAAGSSAGAHLASFAALTPNDPAFQPGFEDADTSVTAAVCLYGYYGPSDSGRPSSPPAYLGDAPPFFVVHGELDTVVLVEDARDFVDQLRSASSQPVVYAELPGAQHTFDLFHSIRFETVVDAIEVFTAWVRAKEMYRN